MIDQTKSTTQPLSSQEYLQMLRQKRQQQAQEVPQFQTTTQPSTEETPVAAQFPNQETPQAPPLPTQAAASPPADELTFAQEKSTQPPTQAQAEVFPGMPKPLPKKTITSWVAPSRPFKKRNRQYYTTVILIVFLISLILFFAGQFLPIAVVISIGFLAYVLSSVPPHEIKIDLNTYGIEIAESLYYWEEMGRFWFENKYDQEILSIEIGRFPGRLVLLFPAEEKKALRKLLTEVLLEEKPADTFYDKAGKWLQEKIPLELNA